MPRGRQSRKLSPEQIQRLEKFRKSPHEGAPHGYSLPQLRLAMGAQFGWQTLKSALLGVPIWDLSHAYIVQWMERFLSNAPVSTGGPPKPIRDGKAASAGDREDPDNGAPMGDPHGRSVDQEAGEADGQHEKETGATGTVRGSR